MAESAFTQAFLHRAIEIEKTASTTELKLLDRPWLISYDDPSLAGRLSTFYDPQHPTFFFRAGPFLIEFAVNDETDTVTFVSLLYRG